MRFFGYLIVAIAVATSIVGVAVSYQSLRRKSDEDDDIN